MKKKVEAVFSIEIRGKQIPARVVRESRRSIRASVGKDAVVLRMPLQATTQAQQEYLAHFESWLEKKSEQYPELLSR